MVVLQHSTETRAQLDGADFLRMIATSFDQLVVDSLVVSFNVVVRHILGYHVPEMLLAKEDHSIKAGTVPLWLLPVSMPDFDS